jgi:biphenyl 2,3-dioxygenase beta subunit
MPTVTEREVPADEQVAEMLLQHRVEQVYYTEARLIDEREFQAWLALFTDDTRYLVPIRRNQTGVEFTDALGDSGLAHFDDDKTVLARRVTRMGSGLAWTEDPPSIQRHLVTGVQITRDDSHELTVHSNSFVIAARTVYLDHTTVLANNLNLFF